MQMNRYRRAFMALCLAIGALALTSGTAEAQKKQKDRITREEILGTSQKDADMYQVIRALRPHFLAPPKGIRSFGGSNIDPIAVVVDGRRETGIDALRLMLPADVEEVRYFEPSKSQSEFGPTASSGAIVVKLCKGSSPVAGDTTGKRQGC
jgi:hypothetical protein